MAVVAMTCAKKNPSGKTLFHVSFSSTNASGGVAVKAAPSAGSIYITKYQVSYVAAAIGTLGDGSTDIQFVGATAGATGPVVEPNGGIKMAAETALTLTAGSGNIAGFVEGFVA